MQIFATPTYERAIRRLLPDDSRREMEDAIVADPTGASVVPGTGGIRKLRWAGSGRVSGAAFGRFTSIIPIQKPSIC